MSIGERFAVRDDHLVQKLHADGFLTEQRGKVAGHDLPNSEHLSKCHDGASTIPASNANHKIFLGAFVSFKFRIRKSELG